MDFGWTILPDLTNLFGDILVKGQDRALERCAARSSCHAFALGDFGILRPKERRNCDFGVQLVVELTIKHLETGGPPLL